MSNYVTISCISHSPPTLDAGLPHGRAVDIMITHWRDRLESVLAEDPDIIVLPEHRDHPIIPGCTPDWRRGFLARRGDDVRDFFAEIASRHRTYVAYSAHRLTSDGSMYNSIQMIDRSGEVVGVYDKVYLTPGEYLDYNLRHGTDLPIFDLDFGRVAPAICFDMHFDDYRTARARQRPDLILFSSAYHGGLVQPAWAFQARAYLAGSIIPPASSSILSPVGDLLGESIDQGYRVTRTVNFDAAVLARPANRDKFDEIKRRYRKDVRIHDPGRLGAVLLTSESTKFTVHDVIEEFGLERIDDYYDRIRAERSKWAPPLPD